MTNVALDHTELLGHTLGEIAVEKAGILRPGRPAVTALDPDLWPALQATGADLWAVGRDFQVETGAISERGSHFAVVWPGQQPWELQTPLIGQHSARNAALAAVAAHRLGVELPAVRAGLAQTHWPGRLERLKVQGQTFWLDGTHNPAGAQATAEALRALGLEDLTLIFGAAADKDVAGVAAALAPRWAAYS
ncbi:glutamate ligase domain-containing protein [Deinococcus lacus]|uniref:tetrahydrofolate synthase n=1 Tax=Deinococcus lacus TaxID=392561 RepID=A0ABW1YC56_9DEIO